MMNRLLMTTGLLVALAPASSSAQSCPLARDCTQTVEMTAPFATRDQSLWGPQGDQSLLEAVTFTIFDNRWNAEGSDDDKQTFGKNTWWGGSNGWIFGGSIDGRTSGRAASFLDITEFGKAAIDIDYPVRVAVTWPEPNTFRAGEPVTIRTSWEPVAEDMHLLTRMGATDMTLRGVFGMNASAGFSICVVSCESLPFFPDMTIAEAGFPIFETVDGSFGIADQEPTDPAGVADFLAAKRTGIEGFLTTPDPLGEYEFAGPLLSARGSDEWVVLNIDWDQYIGFLAAAGGTLLPPLGACLELEEKYNAFDLCYETVDLDYQFRVIQDDAVSFRGSTLVRVDFPSPLGYDVLAPDGTVSESGSAATVSLPVGHDLVVHTPPSVEPSALASTFSLENTLSRQTELTFPSWHTHQALQLSFDMAEVSNSKSRQVDDGSWKFKWNCGSWSAATRWICDAARDLSSAAARAASDAWKWVENIVTQTVARTANAAAFDVGPLYKVDFEEIEADMRIFDRDWALGGFADVSGPAFILDPENPIIAVASSLMNTGLATGADYGSVTQTLVVENQGDVPLGATSLIDAVTPTGLAAHLIESVEIAVHDGFDGSGQPETLAEGQTLPVGASATVTIRWAAVPGVHTASVLAGGTSPIGTLVEDEVQSAFAWAPLAVHDPGDEMPTLNRRSRGVTPIHVLGSDALDVGAIDHSSLAVEGVAPQRVNRGDVNGDGRTDLTLLVPTRDLLAALDARMAGYGAIIVASASDAQVGEHSISIAPVAPDRVAAALLGGAASDTDRAAMDAAGNRNGRLDVGDLRAAVFGQVGDGPAPVIAAAPGKAQGNAQGGAHGDMWVLVLTGALGDGTTLWAEDTARIIGESR